MFSDKKERQELGNKKYGSELKNVTLTPAQEVNVKQMLEKFDIKDYKIVTGPGTGLYIEGYSEAKKQIIKVGIGS